jgi:hypothetical protein
MICLIYHKTALEIRCITNGISNSYDTQVEWLRWPGLLITRPATGFIIAAFLKAFHSNTDINLAPETGPAGDNANAGATTGTANPASETSPAGDNANTGTAIGTTNPASETSPARDNTNTSTTTSTANPAPKPGLAGDNTNTSTANIGASTNGPAGGIAPPAGPPGGNANASTNANNITSNNNINEYVICHERLEPLRLDIGVIIPYGHKSYY